MDLTRSQQQKKQKKTNLTQFMIESEFLKRVITNLVLSVSVFSLFFSYYSSWFSLLHSLNRCFSTLPLKLLSHTLDKNCTFLLCNGLLVFLAKYSGLFSSSSSSSSSTSTSAPTPSKYFSYNTLNEYSYKSFEQDSRPVMILVEAEEPLTLEKEEARETTSTRADMAPENEHKHDEQEVEIITKLPEASDQKFLVEEDKLRGEEEEKQAFVEEEEEEEEEVNGETESAGLFWEEIHEEEEDEERGGNGMLTTEELNKKFDDFIRKMKEELRIEAQRQLVMV